jgi:hypothetical protein
MANYAPRDALTFAKTMVKSMPVDDTTVSYQILDYVSAIMWMAAPWRWTLGTLTQTPLVAGTVDYTVTIPADFAYLETAYLTDGNTSNSLYIDSYLPAATSAGLVTKVAHIPGSPDVLRVHPKPPASYTPTLVTLYKKLPTKITSSNYATAGTTGLPDQWFWVYQLGVLWLAYHYADDVQRAGLATLNSQGQVQYTGFLGGFQSGLDEMRKSEKLPMTPAGIKERG